MSDTMSHQNTSGQRLGRNEWFVTSIGTAFILLFVYTGMTKLFEHPYFRTTFLALHFSTAWSGFLSYFFPTLELFIAACLIVGLGVSNQRITRVGLLGSAALMAVFTFYLIYMVVFIAHLPCSCGGVIQRMSWKQHIVFNLLLLFFSISGLRLIGKKGIGKPWRPGTPNADNLIIGQ
jgi:hypothetical protein